MNAGALSELDSRSRLLVWRYFGRGRGLRMLRMMNAPMAHEHAHEHGHA